MHIRISEDRDTDDIWRILEPVIREGETYAVPRHWTRTEALGYWFTKGREVFVADLNGTIVGTYFLQRNQQGGGAHVANCGYVTAKDASGRGVGRAMCEHSLELAKSRGFLTMQFNFVISSNERAVALWQAFGFEIVGRVPAAFQHPRLGYVDALVMWRKL